MKKILLLIALSASCASFAQMNIQLTFSPSGISIAPNQVIPATTAPNAPTKITVDVKNTSTTTNTYRAKRYDIQLNPGGDANFCFAGACYVSLVNVSTNNLTLTPGQKASEVSGSYQMLGMDFDEGPTVGQSVIKYTVYNEAVSADSIQVTVKYNFPAALNHYENSALTADIFPNPSSEGSVIRLNSPAGGNCAVAVLNSTGALVQELSTVLSEGENKLYLDAGALCTGIYFVRVKAGHQTITRKLIVE